MANTPLDIEYDINLMMKETRKKRIVDDSNVLLNGSISYSIGDWNSGEFTGNHYDSLVSFNIKSLDDIDAHKIYAGDNIQSVFKLSL